MAETRGEARRVARGGGLAGRALRRRTGQLVAMYACAAALWIAFSDRLLGSLVRDPATIIQLSAYKGFFFVVVTSGLLYLLLRRSVAIIEAGFAALETKEIERRRHEEERIHAESIIAHTDDAIVTCALDGAVASFNPAAERLFGHRASEIVGRPMAILVPEPQQRRLEAILASITDGERVEHLETELCHRDGSRLPVSVTLSPVRRGPERAVRGVSAIVRDIAARKLTEAALLRSEERHWTTLESILEGCQILDHAWRYVYVNEAAVRHNRRPQAEMLGRTLQEVWPGIEATQVFGLLEAAMKERVPCLEEVEFAFPDGSTGWFDVRVHPIPEGIFVLSVDTSERKRAELALRELNENLERKVEERTVALAAARERAEAADRIKSAFLATMSHELRTPLNSILGFTGIILQGLAGPLTAEQVKQLGMVQTSARHLLDLINDVLDISKIEAGELDVRFAPFDLRAAIERVTSVVLPLATKKGLDVRLEIPDGALAIVSDRRRVEQILLNLLNNAIKFTDRGGVTLAVALEREEGGDTANVGRLARMTVSDTGIGIDAQHLELIFEPFRQVDSGLQRQHEGTGLGLAICRRLVGLLGGTISVASDRGKGSTFTVVLPARS